MSAPSFLCLFPHLTSTPAPGDRWLPVEGDEAKADLERFIAPPVANPKRKTFFSSAFSVGAVSGPSKVSPTAGPSAAPAVAQAMTFTATIGGPLDAILVDGE